MKATIEQINHSIENKRDRLKEKTERAFSAIVIPNSSYQKNDVTNSKKTPPITYLLYGIAGISAVGAIASDSSEGKWLGIGLAAASGIGGLFLSNRSVGATIPDQTNPSIDLRSVKVSVSAKIIDAVKALTNEWDEFMTIKQKEVNNAINASDCDDSRKDSLYSKVYLYEVLNISLLEFSDMIKPVDNAAELKQKINSYQTKLLKAIDDVATKQIAKYNTLC